MKEVIVKLINKSNNVTPEYSTLGSSGFDIRANIEESIILNSRSKLIIPTGLYFEIPLGYEIQIRSRSGLAAQSSIFVLNSPGTIDSDYRGELKIILFNADNHYLKLIQEIGLLKELFKK